MRILIAEDDSTSRLIVEAAVAQLGHEFVSAKDGQEAWRLFNIGKTDVVVSDRSMPLMDGLELCRRIRGSPGVGYPYFIFLTSLSDKGRIQDGMDAGADDYLSKPLDPDELSARLVVAARITDLYRQLAGQQSELELLNHKLFDQARTDELTQVANRVKLRDDLAAIARGIAHHGSTYCAIMYDVDHFKLYNDTYGHLDGDEVLRAVAGKLSDNSRPGDQTYRYGGEEFLVILPKEELDGGFQCAERHRAAIEHLAIAHRESPLGRVTVSAGVAEFTQSHGGTIKDWIARADGALYRAKQMGRNRVLAAESTTQSEKPGNLTRVGSPGANGNTYQNTPLSNFLVPDGSGTVADGLNRVLQAIRAHLGMDVAFISEFAGGRRVFRQMDAAVGNAPMRVGDSDPLEDGYCQRVVDGRLPELIPDTSAVPEALSLPVTTTLPVGAHLSIPIRLRDGAVYGTFCAFSFSPNPSLNERDLNMMRAFAELASHQIQRNLDATHKQDQRIGLIKRVIEERQFAIVYQPIYRLESKQIAGFECLSRFSAEPSRSPEEWFTEAAEVGLGVELELAAVEMALSALPSLPADIYLAVNASFATIISPEFESVIESVPPGRLVLELTEHDSISEYEHLFRILEPLRQKGVRVAVDDAGAGYSSFRHILRIKPDLIKLDRSLVQGVDTDPGRRALAAALIGFARATESHVVAEGIETASELIAVRLLGAENGQGYFLGRPLSLESYLSGPRPAESPQAGQLRRVNQTGR